MPRIPSRKFNVAVHAVGLRNDFPDSVVELGRGRICWTGYLQPTPLSERYRVKIEYSGQTRPVVNVISPKLVIPDGKVRLPHVFSDSKDLCLHYSGEWEPGMSIAATIVPWTSEWLLHYEIWRVTGTWAGGGHEPSAGAKRDSKAGSGGSNPNAGSGRAARNRR